ncbi:MAG: hypothetical protein DWQ06_08925 [Calditrichaeota bacterium]|nr:MAG: hypothetical protein DWQ06_08925 [Calditrichota bacterium]
MFSKLNKKFKFFKDSEAGISIIAALAFNLATVLMATSWAYFATSQSGPSYSRVEAVQNGYILKGFNSLIAVSSNSIDWFKAQTLANFSINYQPSSFIPNGATYDGIQTIELSPVPGDENNFVLETGIDLNDNAVTSKQATTFSNNSTFGKYYWLTDCERQRQEFVPPDCTNCPSAVELCSDSQQFLLLRGPDRFDGLVHTNDFFFFGGPPNVTMQKCVTASGLYAAVPPIPAGTLMFPPPPLAGVTFLDECNASGMVVRDAPIDFSQTPDLVLNAALAGGVYVTVPDPTSAKRIRFTSTGMVIQESNKALLQLFGPGVWGGDQQVAYPENGAVFVTGDVYISGLVNSDLTVGSCGNIIIDNDLKYACTDSTGLNFTGVECDDKLGLIAVKNILMDTRHIATNKGFSWANFDSSYAHNSHQEGVIINAGMVALGESFMTFSADFPNFERYPGDPYGGTSNPTYPLLGNHGTINHLGSIAQKRRGIINQGTRGGYGGTLLGTGATGPQRIGIYDTRFTTSPPRYFFSVGQSDLSLVVR